MKQLEAFLVFVTYSFGLMIWKTKQIVCTCLCNYSPNILFMMRETKKKYARESNDNGGL